VKKNLAQGDLTSTAMLGRQKMKKMQKLVVRARMAALRSWAILSKAICASLSTGVRSSVNPRLRRNLETWQVPKLKFNYP